MNTLQLPGSKILAMLAGSVDSISVNPCAAESISFPKQLLPELAKWGEAIEVERALSSVLQNETGWKAIRDYDSYIVPVTQTADGQFAPYPAPDSMGRKLLAAFTFSDALNAYVFDQHGGKPVDVTIYTGDFLCKWILESACDGVMFNCSGPNRSIAFPEGIPPKPCWITRRRCEGEFHRIKMAVRFGFSRPSSPTALTRARSAFSTAWTSIHNPGKTALMEIENAITSLSDSDLALPSSAYRAGHSKNEVIAASGKRPGSSTARLGRNACAL